MATRTQPNEHNSEDKPPGQRLLVSPGASGRPPARAGLPHLHAGVQESCGGARQLDRGGDVAAHNGAVHLWGSVSGERRAAHPEERGTGGTGGEVWGQVSCAEQQEKHLCDRRTD